MNEFVLPLWAEILIAVLVLGGALIALLGSLGLMRLESYFERVHTPSIIATMGCWLIMWATFVFFSATGQGLALHAPEIVATYNKYKDQGYDTLAVAMSYDPPSYVLNFAQSRQLPFQVAIDNTGAVAKAWGDVKLTPTTYIVNKRGEIVKTYIGQPDFAELHQLIEKLLAEA